MGGAISAYHERRGARRSANTAPAAEPNATPTSSSSQATCAGGPSTARGRVTSPSANSAVDAPASAGTRARIAGVPVSSRHSAAAVIATTVPRTGDPDHPASAGTASPSRSDAVTATAASA